MFGRGPPSVRLRFGCCGCRAECVLLAGAARLTVSDRQLAAGLDAGVTAVLVAAFQRRWRVFAGRGRAAWWCRWRPRLASQRPTDTTSRPPRHRTFPAGIPPEWETSPPSAPPAAATVAAGAPQAHVSTVQVPQLPRDYVPKGGEWPEGAPRGQRPQRSTPRAGHRQELPQMLRQAKDQCQRGRQEHRNRLPNRLQPPRRKKLAQPHHHRPTRDPLQPPPMGQRTQAQPLRAHKPGRTDLLSVIARINAKLWRTAHRLRSGMPKR